MKPCFSIIFGALHGLKTNTDTSYDRVKFKYLNNISIPTAEASQWALIVS